VRVLIVTAGSRGEFLDAQLERLDELIAPLATGSIPAATGRPTTRCGASCSPGCAHK